MFYSNTIIKNILVIILITLYTQFSFAEIPIFSGLDRNLNYKKDLTKQLIFKTERKIYLKKRKPQSFTNPSFEDDALSLLGWTSDGTTSVEDNTFGVSPTDGAQQALLVNTGGVTDASAETTLGIMNGSLDMVSGGDVTAGSFIYQTITVSTGDKIRFDWNFLTSESTPSSFNDVSFFTVSGRPPVKLADTNFSPFEPSASTLFPEETEYQNFEYTFTSSGTVTIGFVVMQETDTSVDSGLLVDNIKFCPISNLAPTGTIPPISILEDNTFNSSIDLTSIFTDDTDSPFDLTYTIISVSNTDLFSNYEIDNITQTLNLQYEYDAFGTSNITIRITDTCGKSSLETFPVVIAPVNDPPYFFRGSNQVTVEDSGPQAIANWATNISPGADNETAQTLNFNLNITSTSGDIAFVTPPSVDATTGDLTYEVVANTNGFADVEITLMDDGGTTNGGDDTSFPDSFTIVVNEVNDAPMFTVGADQIVNEDVGTVVIDNWVTNIIPGPSNESTQNINFLVNVASTTGDLAFSTGPSVSPNGQLSFTPTPNTFGTAVVNIKAKDNGGTANGGIDESMEQTFNITVNSVNDAPSLDPIPNTIVVPAVLREIDLNNITSGANNENQNITITAVSDDVSIIPDPDINYISPDNTGILSFTPVASSGNATITVTIQDDGGTANGGQDMQQYVFDVSVQPINESPTLSAISTQDIVLTNEIQSLTLSGITSGDMFTTVVLVEATSDNPSVVPNPMISYMPPASIATLSYETLAVGTANITVRVRDDGNTANGGVNEIEVNFTINVYADFPNKTPTLDAIDDISIITGDVVTVDLLGISAGVGEMQNLTITAFSNDPDVLPHPTVNYTSPNATGTLTLNPQLFTEGDIIITVTVQDDGGTVAGSQDAITRTFIADVELANSLENLSSQSLKIYPNPSQDNIFVEIPEEIKQGFKIKILDLQGKTQFQKQYQNSEDTIQINLRGLSRGEYILVLEQKDEIYQQKIIKF